MKISVDIPYPVLKEAVNLIEAQKGKCQILPNARLSMPNWSNEFQLETLVCSNKMGLKQTGIGAQHCKNCLLTLQKPLKIEETITNE